MSFLVWRLNLFEQIYPENNIQWVWGCRIIIVLPRNRLLIRGKKKKKKRHNTVRGNYFSVIILLLRTVNTWIKILWTEFYEILHRVIIYLEALGHGITLMFLRFSAHCDWFGKGKECRNLLFGFAYMWYNPLFTKNFYISSLFPW